MRFEVVLTEDAERDLEDSSTLRRTIRPRAPSVS
jgi:hypothetical protein